MNLQTYTFAIRRPDGASLDGLALVAPIVRYASTFWLGSERFDRRFTEVARWPEIEREIATGFVGPLPPSGALWRLLAGDHDGTVVLYVRAQTLEIASPAGAAAALDGALRQEAGAAPA